MKKPQVPPGIPRKLPDEFTGFTSRLHQGGEEGKRISQLVQKYNEREYIHWDDLRRKKIPYDPVVLWHAIASLRTTRYRVIRIGAEKFRFTLPESFHKQLHLIDKASPASFDWLFGQSPGEAARKHYLINSLMEEAIASSQLEGAATTRPEAKKILREGRMPKNTSERMIVNNYRTISRLKELRGQPLSRDLLLEIHHEITRGTLESDEDETDFRNRDDIVVSSKTDPAQVYHYPPAGKKVPAMVDDLCAFANADDEFIHPIVKAIILHFLIGYIHPFNDGNGRTARAIFYWFALKHHYDLLEYLSISRIFVHAPTQYARAYLLTETDSNDMTYFIDFNIRIISRALDDLKQYLITKKEEEAASLLLVEEMPDISLRQAEILRECIRHPARPYTISEIAGKYKISLPTARTDLNLLAEMGRLKKYQDGKRQVFIYNRQASR
ncbi:MAG: Fic family protein [Methanomicrobiales archaeon]|nr:Fic family protein [Methanomicrobiales archaeon]